MEKKTQIIGIVVGTALMHNGTRYDIGSEISLSPEEFAELSIYVQHKDDYVAAQQQTKATAKATAAALAKEANAEYERLQQAVIEAQEAHIKAEALATENGLRADLAEARVAELDAQLAKLSAELTACKKAKEPKGKKADADSHNTENG